MELDAAAASLSLGPCDVAVHDAVFFIEKYAGDPFAAGALGPMLAELGTSCGVGVRVYCKVSVAAVSIEGGAEGSAEGGEEGPQRGVEDVYIIAGGIGDTIVNFVERCLATEGLVKGDSALQATTSDSGRLTCHSL